ncbi:Nn.00g084350.m01.CDS01 [Neocucurbitaria sp. VM-36]
MAIIEASPKVTSDSRSSIEQSYHTHTARLVFPILQSLDVDVSDIDSDEEVTSKLTNLVDREAGTTSAGSRDTIDSILSRYDYGPNSKETYKMENGTKTPDEKQKNVMLDNVRDALQKLAMLQEEMDDVLFGHYTPPHSRVVSQYVATQLGIAPTKSDTKMCVNSQGTNGSDAETVEAFEVGQTTDDAQRVLHTFATAMDGEACAELVLQAALISLFGLVLAAGCYI